MKFAGRVVSVTDAKEYTDGEQRVVIKIGNSAFNTLTISNREGWPLGAEVEVQITLANTKEQPCQPK